jgi:hypothetical protein
MVFSGGHKLFKLWLMRFCFEFIYEKCDFILDLFVALFKSAEIRSIKLMNYTGKCLNNLEEMDYKKMVKHSWCRYRRLFWSIWVIDLLFFKSACHPWLLVLITQVSYWGSPKKSEYRTPFSPYKTCFKIHGKKNKKKL